MPDVTVALCTYNRAEFLGESIRSVLNQSYREIRVIVYDNGSSDETEGVVKSFLDDDRLSYVRHDHNIGAVANFNFALDNCDTEYINIFHDDDLMAPDMIAREFSVMKSSPSVAMVGSHSMVLIDQEGRERGKVFYDGSDRYFEGDEWIKNVCFIGRNPICCPSVMLRKSFLDKHRLRFRSDIGPATDLFFWLEICDAGGGIFSFSDPMVYHRVHPGADSIATNLNVWADSLHRCEMLMRKVAPDASFKKICSFFCDFAVSGMAWDLVRGDLSYGKYLENKKNIQKDFGRDWTPSFCQEFKWASKWLLYRLGLLR